MTGLEHKSYYYVYDVNRHPRITVCIARHHDGRVAKGIAICSLSEQPVKRKGRNEARGKVLRAFGTNSTSCGINRSEAMKVLAKISDSHTKTFGLSDINYKSILFPPGYSGDNELERKLIKKWNRTS